MIDLLKSSRSIGKLILIGASPKTLAEWDAYLTGLAPNKRDDADGSQFEVSGDTAANNGLYAATAAGRVKISNDLDAGGTMKSFGIGVGSNSIVVEEADSFSFRGAGLLKVALDETTNEIAHELQAPVSDEGKKLTVAADGTIVTTTDFTFGNTYSAHISDDATTGAKVVDVKLTPTGAIGTYSDGLGVRLSTSTVGGVNATTIVDNGIYTKPVTVKAGSGLTITDNEIDLAKFDDNGEIFETAQTSIADYVASGEITTNKHGKADTVYFTNADGVIEGWKSKVVSPTTVADFIRTTGSNTSETVIRQAVTANLGVKKSVDGVFSADLRAVESGKPNGMKLEGNLLYSNAYEEVEEGKTTTLSTRLFEAEFDSKRAVDATYTNALTKTVNATTGAIAVTWEGDYAKNTTVDAVDYLVTLGGRGTGGYFFDTENVSVKHSLTFLNDDDILCKMKVNSLGRFYCAQFGPNL